jgi:hypothetical protein
MVGKPKLRPICDARRHSLDGGICSVFGERAYGVEFERSDLAVQAPLDAESNHVLLARPASHRMAASCAPARRVALFVHPRSECVRFPHIGLAIDRSLPWV